MTTTTMPLPPCRSCRRPMYRSTERPFPGGVKHDSDGVCNTCIQRTRRAGDSDGVPEPARLFVVRDWTEDALCAQTDPEAFFPEKGQSTRNAKGICRQCPVRAECLTWALDNNERFGVWGGLSEQERDGLRRRAS